LNLSSFSDSIFSQVTNIDPDMLHNRRRLYRTDDFPLKWSYQGERVKSSGVLPMVRCNISIEFLTTRLSFYS
jgi:hypothetical protein